MDFNLDVNSPMRIQIRIGPHWPLHAFQGNLTGWPFGCDRLLPRSRVIAVMERYDSRH